MTQQIEKVRAISRRDWSAMSWYHRQQWMRLYAVTHREPEQERKTKARVPEVVRRTEAILAEDPFTTASQIAEELGYSKAHGLRRALRRAGRPDLADTVPMQSGPRGTRASQMVVAEVEASLQTDPNVSMRELVERLGYKDRHAVRQALKRQGRRDLLDALSGNGRNPRRTEAAA